MFRQRFLTLMVVVGIVFSQFVSYSRAEAGTCDWAKFISDVTVSGNASFPPGVPFTKTWRLQNIGTCTWTASYSLVHYSGEQMGGPASVNLPKQVAPGEMIDISINLISPATGGQHDGTWILSNASGVRFGTSSNAAMPIWVDIFVVDSNVVAFDFVANAPYAQWQSGTGTLPFPGTSGDSRGYALKLDYPHLEDGSIDPQPGLLAVPQNKFDGYIQATYPEFLVQLGDRLQTAVNCEYGATGCYVTFRIDYRTSNGVVNTLWKFKEAYEGKLYRANIDLNPLAGQNVRFILMVLATGSAGGDRALWGAPRVLRLGGATPPPPTVTPLPPLTPTQTPFSTPPIVSPESCDKASFIADIRVPDGTIFTPGAAFTKSWRLKNSGSCTWTTAYSIVFYGGDQMGASTSVNFPYAVPPGQTVDLTVNMVAPGIEGEYRGFWILRNISGALFGIGKNADAPFWVEIKVMGGTPTEIGYDFWANACAAQWRSGAGILPCPSSTDADPKGLVIKANYTQLEDGTMGPAPSLLMVPNNNYNGYIQGIYPTFTVQPGDRFFTTVGCEYHASCYVTLQLDYMTATGYVKTFWTWREQNEGLNHTADVNLTPLVGQSVRFILTVLATGPATGDRVRWVAPYILRAGTVIPSASPTSTSTSTPEQTGLIIRGRVTQNGVGLPNVRIYRSFAVYPGELAATTDANGYYQSAFVFIPGDEMVTVRAELEGYSFDPPNYFWRHYHGLEDTTLNFSASLTPTITPTFTPVSNPLPDLTIGTMAITLEDPSCLKPSGNVSGVRVPILNQGQAAATGFMVEVNGVQMPVDGLGIGEMKILFFPSDRNPVTAMVDPTSMVAESDETNNARTEMLPEPTPPLPCITPTFTPSPTLTATPAALLGPYAVTLVPLNDMLNIRSGPGASNPVIGSFARDATNIMRTGPAQQADGGQWVEVLMPDGASRGWVNSYYLTEYVSRASFCTDTRLVPVLGNLKQAMITSNGALFASLVSPKHGMNMNYWQYGPAVNYTSVSAQMAFTDPQVINWGSGGGSGIVDTGTFAQIIQPQMVDVFNSAYQFSCDDASYAYMYPNPWQYANIHYYAVIKPPTNVFDWKVWLIGIEYVNGSPYLFGAIHFVWEP